MTITRCLTMVSLAAALLAPAQAQTSVNERQAAAPDGVVSIDNATGTLKITGWDKAEVAVTGRLGAGAEGVTLEKHGKRISLEVELTHGPQAEGALEISVPSGSSLEISGFNAETTIGGVTGAIHVETVNGRIEVVAAGGALELQTVNGAIEVTGTSSRVQAEAVNGPVTLTGLGGEIQVSTVNGPLVFEGGTLTRGEFQTVAGPLRVQADLADGARLELQSVSGGIELALPRDVSASFEVTTFSGSVTNELGPPARANQRYTTQKELTFSTGTGSASVDVETHSGVIKLRKR